MSDYVCPWCGEEIDDPDYWEREPGDSCEVECPGCGRELSVWYEMDPSFNVDIPAELEACRECGCWDQVRECCARGKPMSPGLMYLIERGAAEPPSPLECCPLGHRGEEGEGNEQ